MRTDLGRVSAGRRDVRFHSRHGRDWRGPKNGPRAQTGAPSALVQARDRLGETPMAWLFQRSADAWAHASADRSYPRVVKVKLSSCPKKRRTAAANKPARRKGSK